MKLTKEQLKRIIKEELENVLGESKLQKLLGLSHNFGAVELYNKALEYIAHNQDNIGAKAEMISNAITNRMVKDQISKEDPMGEKFGMLLNMLDSDRHRRQAYRASTEREMRDLSDKYDKKGVGEYSQERPFEIRKKYKE